MKENIGMENNLQIFIKRNLEYVFGTKHFKLCFSVRIFSQYHSTLFDKILMHTFQ